MIFAAVCIATFSETVNRWKPIYDAEKKQIVGYIREQTTRELKFPLGDLLGFWIITVILLITLPIIFTLEERKAEQQKT